MPTVLTHGMTVRELASATGLSTDEIKSFGIMPTGFRERGKRTLSIFDAVGAAAVAWARRITSDHKALKAIAQNLRDTCVKNFAQQTIHLAVRNRMVKRKPVIDTWTARGEMQTYNVPRHELSVLSVEWHDGFVVTTDCMTP